MKRSRRVPVYLFEKAALAQLETFIHADTLFAFDLDGTLAPIVSEPSLIEIPRPVQTALADLAAAASVAIITGRSRSDALNYLDFTPRYLIGNHGAEGLPGWSDRETDFIRDAQGWQRQLEHLISPEEQTGIVVENKGPTLAVHYRRVVDIRQSQKLISGALVRLTPPPRRIGGKFVDNLLPAEAPDKSVALLTLMRRENINKSIFVGDDETDEDVFRIENDNILKIRVGRKEESRAQYYLRGPYEMGRTLRIINRFLAKP